MNIDEENMLDPVSVFYAVIFPIKDEWRSLIFMESVREFLFSFVVFNCYPFEEQCHVFNTSKHDIGMNSSEFDRSL
jgi:hypothetical protein